MKLLLTRELGRLAKWLRILGIDAFYTTEDNLSCVLIQALRDERVILTRNHRLIRPGGIRVILIQNETVKAQLAEALKVLQVSPDPDRMFTRCILCNEELIKVEKEKVEAKVPEYVYNNQDDFFACPACQRIYWRGTHWGEVKRTLEEAGLA